MTANFNASSFSEMSRLAEHLNTEANNPNATAADRQSSAGARIAVLGALGTLVSKEINRPPTASRAELEQMRPLDAAKFFKVGGTINAD